MEKQSLRKWTEHIVRSEIIFFRILHCPNMKCNGGSGVYTVAVIAFLLKIGFRRIILVIGNYR